MRFPRFVMKNGDSVSINPAHVASVYYGKQYDPNAGAATHIVTASGIGYAVEGSEAEVRERLEEAAGQNAVVYVELGYELNRTVAAR